ncbi:SDR family NAD(P)-dependent oxidoreductase [Anaerosacchariphilus polymeriproducens]|uniref:SDR family NAD(P)-dependent oxidoreductase n=1 Tax=Anaerosacchariphilus polymeriproducens TaxID=1812858 RepID=A0A371AX96_9FIRM|nr:SDR family oxidoreductase [Anaerosacchariphilus polymeriproducens]RDU24204.1 SDR family NAD(P)-dependent oxidoreductase [Anaerosacchariphilus polymeriproducens]
MKTVLITGTTSGIGYEISKIFAMEGHHVILVSRNPEKLRKQKGELQIYNKNINIIVCDLLREDAVDYILKVLEENHWTVNCLVNNAGFNEAGLFWKTDADKERDMIQLHIHLVTALTKRLLPMMLERRDGKILNIGSTASYFPCATDAVYGATKGYILSFSNALYSELNGMGVTVTTLCPGATQTEFAKKAEIENVPLFQSFVMEPQKVARIGYKAMMRGKRVIVAGGVNKLQVLMAKILPAKVLGEISKAVMHQ